MVIIGYGCHCAAVESCLVKIGGREGIVGRISGGGVSHYSELQAALNLPK